MIRQQRFFSTLELAFFLRQLAVLVNAGIPIAESCSILAHSQKKAASALLIKNIKTDLESGHPLSQSLARYPQCFNAFTCQLIQFGEDTGKLDTLLTTIAENQEKIFQQKNRIKSALFYPFCLLVLMGLILMIMLFFVIPRFAVLFATTTELPLLTRSLFTLATFLQQHFWLLIFFILLIVSFILMLAKTSTYALRTLFLRLPFIRTIYEKMGLRHFASCLALAFTAGVPLEQALKQIALLDKNHPLAASVLQLRPYIQQGFQLNHAMRMCLSFPPFLIQMVRIGEESGSVTYMLQKSAEFLATEIEQQTENACRLLEPLIMVILGVLIGTLMVGMYLPLFKLGTTF